jgi:hypothetical protein
MLGCATVHEAADRLTDNKVNASLATSADCDELLFSSARSCGHHGARNGK